MRGGKLTHLDSSNRPRMVDVGAKAATARAAVAEAVVRFPEDVAGA
jgi:cyclic pyranopterin phosphate synthase